jgi:hypothetical protein
MGYVPLLTQVDPAIPIQVQAQEAYERLLPELLAAQKSGAILDFEPSFNVGIVKIKYPAGVGVSMLDGMTVLDNIQDAAAMVPRTPPAHLADAITPEAYSPQIYSYLYDGCFDVYNLEAGDHVVGSLRNTAGKIVAVSDDSYSGSDDYLTSCFNGSYDSVLPGYKVTFKIYNTTDALRGTYSSAVPALAITALDKVNSKASGTGPAGKPYYAWWSHPNLNAGNTYQFIQKEGTISGAKTWSVDFGTTKFLGGDGVGIDVIMSANLIFLRWMNVPYARCTLGGYECGVRGFPNKAASMSITHAGVPHTFTGKFDKFWGWFEVSLEDGDGHPVFLAAGDKVQGTGVPMYALPKLTATINYTTDVVSGKAPANKYFRVEVQDISEGYWYSVWAHSNASGDYSADFSSMVDMKTTKAYEVYLPYYDPASGNRTYLDQAFGP